MCVCVCVCVCVCACVCCILFLVSEHKGYFTLHLYQFHGQESNSINLSMRCCKPQQVESGGRDKYGLFWLCPHLMSGTSLQCVGPSLSPSVRHTHTHTAIGRCWLLALAYTITSQCHCLDNCKCSRLLCSPRSAV